MINKPGNLKYGKILCFKQENKTLERCRLFHTFVNGFKPTYRVYKHSSSKQNNLSIFGAKLLLYINVAK